MAAYLWILDDDELDGGRQSYPDEALEELRAAGDGDELCRLLLGSQWGWRSSTRPVEAVELLRAFAGTGELGDCFLALLLCTCARWARVTAKLVAQLEASGLLSSADLDELAEPFVSEEIHVECSLGWLAPERLSLDPGPDGPEPVRLPESTPTTTKLTVEPPLRRWAAARALRGRPERLGDLLALSRRLPKRHGHAVLHGLLDAAGALAEADRRALVARGLGTGQGAVRLAALDLLCADKGPDAARRRARADADARVRAWRPPSTAPATPLG